MDEDGTVVYFKTSPALLGQDEQFSDEFSFSVATATDSSKKEPSSSVATLQNSFWKKTFGFGGRVLRHVFNDVECRHGIAEMIRDSPLLTEEDYKLLTFVLLNPHPLQTTPQDQTIHFSSKRVAVVLVAVLAACAIQFSWCVLLLCVVLVTLSLYDVCVLLHSQHKRSLRSASQAVTSYCHEAEALLSLLSHCLRIIQETEMVSRGYSRPSRGVPVSRIEGSSESYQCVGLRCRLFSSCQTVLGRLRETTLGLCQLYPLRGELGDSTTSYLAHSSLDSLHPHISTDLDTVSEEGTEKHKCLSLESLKDAANLLAVQNSELLRHLALVSLTLPRSEAPLGRLTGGVVQAVEETLGEVRRGLQWSCDFHKNRLFGSPPSRPSSRQPSTEATSSSSSSSSSPVAELVREVHLMDLKTQTALQRMRDLGSQLSTAGDSEVSTYIHKFEEQLNATQCIIDAVSDHIEDSLNIIHTLEHSQYAHKGGTVGEESGVKDGSADEDAEPVTREPDLLNEDSYSSSDDDMVFEAYVPAMGANEGGATESMWREAEGGMRGREVGAKMVRELENVLAVRSEKRERWREEKRQRRRERREGTYAQEDRENGNTGAPSHTEPSEPHCSSSVDTTSSHDLGDTAPYPSTEQEMEKELQLPSNTGAASHTNTPEQLCRVSPLPSQDSPSTEQQVNRELELPESGEEHSTAGLTEPSSSDVTAERQTYGLLSTDVTVTSGDPSTSQLASQVAAIAASRRRMEETEETYGSDNSSHSE